MNKTSFEIPGISTVLICLLFVVFRQVESPLVFLTIFIVLAGMITRLICQLLMDMYPVITPGVPFKETALSVAIWVAALIMYSSVLVLLVSGLLDKAPILKALILKS